MIEEHHLSPPSSIEGLDDHHPHDPTSTQEFLINLITTSSNQDKAIDEPLNTSSTPPLSANSSTSPTTTSSPSSSASSHSRSFSFASNQSTIIEAEQQTNQLERTNSSENILAIHQLQQRPDGDHHSIDPNQIYIPTTTGSDPDPHPHPNDSSSDHDHHDASSISSSELQHQRRLRLIDAHRTSTRLTIEPSDREIVETDHNDHPNHRSSRYQNQADETMMNIIGNPSSPSDSHHQNQNQNQNQNTHSIQTLILLTSINQKKAFEFDPLFTILNVKDYLLNQWPIDWNQKEIPQVKNLNQLRMVYMGRFLNDHDILNCLGVIRPIIIHLVIKPDDGFVKEGLEKQNIRRTMLNYCCTGSYRTMRMTRNHTEEAEEGGGEHTRRSRNANANDSLTDHQNRSRFSNLFCLHLHHHEHLGGCSIS